jgi:ceramide glucosyltransferase
MFSPIETICIAWSAVAACWFVCATMLVFCDRRRISLPTCEASPLVMTIFKPLPPIGPTGVPNQLIRALESFISQMDERTEMLLGIDQEQSPAWENIIDRWKDQFPAARLNVIRLPKPHSFPNPKIAWQILLARHAMGELWLWSDADIEVPKGFLNSIRAELTHSKFRAITCPYSVRTVPGACGLLDALFVNIEFYPGVLLMRRRGVDFALGAATLFYADDFRRRADWERLGATLADDNELGRQLSPIAVSGNTVETLPQEKKFAGAFVHYLRWHKTIRWCEPAGYAGQLMLLPILGWACCTAANPLNPVAWGGLAATGFFELAVATLILRRLKCTFPIRWGWMLLAWTALRPAAWILSWTPVSVRWNGCKHRWLGLRKLELFERS